jgi:hypothetical protein
VLGADDGGESNLTYTASSNAQHGSRNRDGASMGTPQDDPGVMMRHPRQRGCRQAAALR